MQHLSSRELLYLANPTISYGKKMWSLLYVADIA